MRGDYDDVDTLVQLSGGLSLLADPLPAMDSDDMTILDYIIAPPTQTVAGPDIAPPGPAIAHFRPARSRSRPSRTLQQSHSTPAPTIANPDTTAATATFNRALHPVDMVAHPLVIAWIASSVYSERTLGHADGFGSVGHCNACRIFHPLKEVSSEQYAFGGRLMLCGVCYKMRLVSEMLMELGSHYDEDSWRLVYRHMSVLLRLVHAVRRIRADASS